jgi:hypothetical protein
MIKRKWETQPVGKTTLTECTKNSTDDHSQNRSSKHRYVIDRLE